MCSHKLQWHAGRAHDPNTMHTSDCHAMKRFSPFVLMATASAACVKLAHIGLQAPTANMLARIGPDTQIGVHPKQTGAVGGKFSIRVSSTAGSVLEETEFDCAAAPFEVAVLAGHSILSETSQTVEVSIIGAFNEVKEAHLALVGADPWTTSEWVGGFNEMRAEVNVPGPGVFTLLFAAVGCGEVRINGVVVTNPMSPGWAAIPEVATLYESYDISSHMQKGASVIGVRIGKCKWAYRGEYCNGTTAAACNAARFEVHGPEGFSFTSSSVSVTGHQSPIVYDDLYLGETFNASMEQHGWDLPGFSPPVAWAPAATMHPLVGGMRQAIGPPMTLTAGMVPVSVTASPDADAWVFDIGINIAGICRLSIPAATIKAAGLRAGSTVTMEHGELLHPNGSVWNQFDHGCTPNALNCATQRDSYTISDSDLANGVDYRPTFTYHGFRRVSLAGWSHAATAVPDSTTITCYHLGNAVNKISSFEAGPGSAHTVETAGAQAALSRRRLAEVVVSDPASVLQAIDASTHLTQLNNLHGGHPEDCPTREKRGWMGDAAASSPEAVRSFDMSSLYAGWMQAHRDQQTFGCVNPAQGKRPPSAPWWQAMPNHYQCCGTANRFGCNKPGSDPLNASGMLPDVIPFAWAPIGGWPGDPSWMLASVAIPYELFEAFGSTSALALNFDIVYDYLQAVTLPANFDSRGVIAYSYYGDWLAVDKVSDSTLVGTMSLVQALTEGISLAAALNRPVPQWVASGSTIISAFSKAFLNGQGSFGDGTGVQTANALAFVNEVPGAEPFSNDTGKAAQALLQDISKRSTTLSVGVVGSRWLLEALEKMGRGDVAAGLATQTAMPSWGYFVSNSTFPGTLWEQWPGGTASFDHIMFGGGIGKWIHDHAVGIRVSHGVSSKRVARELSGLAAKHGVPTTEAQFEALGAEAAAVMNGLMAEAQTALAGSVTIQPHGAALRKLGRVVGSRQTPLGLIQTEWELAQTSSTSATISATVTLPPAACASHRPGPQLLLPPSSLAHAITGSPLVQVSASSISADGSHVGAADSDTLLLPCGKSVWSINVVARE